MNALAEYMPDASEANGHHNGNGNGHTSKGSQASQKAWQTARERAVAESEERNSQNSARFYAQQDEMLRALTDPHLSEGAARLFCLLVYAGWKKELGGLYRDRVGSVMIDSRRLARLCGGASVNAFYHKFRKEKRDAQGNVTRKASETDGWLEELVKGGYLWIGKHRIPNIPKSKWPNVYNVAVHVPVVITPNLPWADGNWGGEVVVAEDCPTVCDSVLSAPEPPGDTQTPANTTASHRNGGQPVTARGDGQAPHAVLGKHRTGGRASTARGNGQAPHAVTGKHRTGGQGSTARGDGPAVNPVHLRETRGSDPDVQTAKGKGNPPIADGWEKEFKRWQGTLDKAFPSALRASLKDLEEERQSLKDYGAGKPGTPEALKRNRLKIDAVKLRLNGPK